MIYSNENIKVNPHLGKVNNVTWDTITLSVTKYNTMVNKTKKPTYTKKYKIRFIN